jgi:RNA polymerase-binding transcription factor DksA
MASSTRTRKAAAAKRSAAKRSPAASKAAPPAKKAAAKSSAAKSGTAKKQTKQQKTTKKKVAAPAAKAAANGRRTPAAKATAKKVTTPKNGRATKSTGSKPAKTVNGRKKSPFSAAFLAKQKQALIDERAVYLHQAEAFEAEADSLIADFEPGDVQFDEESGEGDTLSTERERDLALSAQARAALEQIDHALAKFDLGTYGICEVSGDPIPKERLEAIPWAKERVEYKAASFTSL